MLLFTVTLCAELVANDNPLLVKFDGHYYAPILKSYPETRFGGEFETETRYRDPLCAQADRRQGLDDLATDSLFLQHHQLRPLISLRHRRRVPRTGLVPTIRAAMCWRALFTAFAFRFCLG